MTDEREHSLYLLKNECKQLLLSICSVSAYASFSTLNLTNQPKETTIRQLNSLNIYLKHMAIRSFSCSEWSTTAGDPRNSQSANVSEARAWLESGLGYAVTGLDFSLAAK